jgi:transcriptional regulator with XRE-family HTH domain
MRGQDTKQAEPAERVSSTRGSVSPLGETHEEARARRARSAAYRQAQQAVAPFEDLARVVILRRRSLGLTQQALADRMETSYSAVSRLESGRHRTSLATLQRLAEALDLELTLDFRAVADDRGETPGRAQPAARRRPRQPAFAARVKLS